MSRRMNHRASHAFATAAIAFVAALSIASPMVAVTAASKSTAPATAMATTASTPTAPAPAPAAFTSTAAPASTSSNTNSDANANAASADDIRDIRGPKGIFPFWQMAALSVGAALLATGGFAAWRWARRRSTKAQQRFEIALQHLEDIRALMQPSSVREFSIAISDIVRLYIEDEFKVTATHRTTEEFLHDLLESSNASLAAHRNLLAQFLNQCDLAKFAGVGLSMRIMETLHQSARSFVIESSKPLPAAETHQALGSTRTPEAHDSLPST